MKIVKLTLVIMAACLITLGLSGMAQAFHEGGVAHCDGCHTMHNSPDNPAEGSIVDNTLKKGSDASSTCLNCHDGSGRYYVNSDDGSNLKLGGDFFWSRKSYTHIVRGNERTSSWQEHGHNITAIDFFGFAADSGAAPGGTYTAANLGCTSCHDPHGKVQGGTKQGSAPISVSGSYGAADPTDGSIHGNYRLLGDSAYETPDEYEFDNDAPVARANSYTSTDGDYGSGMSLWCANCHDYSGVAAKHVSGAAALLTNAANYNSYVKTGDFTGLKATAYDALVPFERGVTDGSLLDPDSTIGPDTNDNVMCITCHRAHATAHENATRWDMSVELIEESASLVSSGSNALTDTEKANSYYKDGSTVDMVAVYGEYQRSLCNKCHAQD